MHEDTHRAEMQRTLTVRGRGVASADPDLTVPRSSGLWLLAGFSLTSVADLRASLDRLVESLMEGRKPGRRSVVKIGKGVLHRFPIGPEPPLIYEVRV
jgi:hypothetical protein